MTLDEWLDACADDPENDQLRLVFADWLDENGDPERAEFIRLRVGQARVPERNQDTAKRFRADQLLKYHRLKWLRPLNAFAGSLNGLVGGDAWAFPRGLPEVLRLTGELTDDDVIRLAASPLLARVTSLDLWRNDFNDNYYAEDGVHGIRDAAVRALAESPYVTRLRTLNLTGHRIGSAGAQALINSAQLARITNLWLADNGGIGESDRALLRQRFGDRVRF